MVTKNGVCQIYSYARNNVSITALFRKENIELEGGYKKL